MSPIVPPPRVPQPADTSAPVPSGRRPDPDARTGRNASPATGSAGAAAAAERFYEDVLGWRTDRGRPLGLLTGLRFDVLELPAAMRPRGAAQVRAHRPGGGRGRAHATARGGRERGGTARAAGVAGMGRHRPGSRGRGGRAAGSPHRHRTGYRLRVRRGPLSGCGPPSRRGVRINSFRPSRVSGAGVGMLPISYGWWIWPRPNATGSG